MRGKGHRALVIILLSCFFSVAILPWISSGAIQITQTGVVYPTLEDAVAAASSTSPQTLLLISNTSVTLTPGNVTQISKSLTIKQNKTDQYSILLNGTIAFNGTLKTYTLSQSDNNHGQVNSLFFSYDSTGPAVFRNNSLFEITGSSNVFILNEPHPDLDPGAFTGTGVNLTGNSNSLSSWIGEIYSGNSQLSIVFKLAGSYNSISDSESSPLITNSSGGVGLDVTGNFNGAPGAPVATGNQGNPATNQPESSPPIYIDTSQMGAPGGSIYIAPSANGNVIRDDGFSLNGTPFTTSPQPIYLFNGTSFEDTTSWYFFNSSWSPSGGNRNLTIDTSRWTFPFGGNVSLVAGYSNITGRATDIVQNSSLSLDTTTGESSGILMNDTSSLKFSTISAVVPVGMSIGNNTYLDVWGTTASTPGSLGYVTVLNFDPYNSLPGENFNKTQTTNWGTIPNFTAAHNLTFVVENPATHALLGNISYDQDLDLLTPGTDSGLAVLGSNLAISPAGNSTNFTMTNTALNSVFNFPATLTMYPNGFPFAGYGNITITATDDSGTMTTLFDKGTWLNYAGFVSPSQDVTVVGDTSITLPVLQFSKFDFFETAPVANFTGTPTSGYAPLTVQFNDTSTYSTPNSWNWSFGDGSFSVVQNSSHSYASAGSYTVNLTTADVGGSNTTSKANYINVSAALPIPSFTGTPTFGNEPLDVQFNDTTLSTGIQYWNWSFGDTTWFNTTDITAKNVTHPYSSIGSYTVNLSITNSSGLSFPATITNTTSVANYINVSAALPIPSFTSNITFGNEPQDIQFNDTTLSTGIRYWNWSFGDTTWFNTTDITAKNVTHPYSAIGSYTVNLSITNSSGLSTPATVTNTTSMANYINVSAALPIPSFTGTPTFGNEPLDVQFNDTTLSTGIQYWNWSFGDNTPWFNTTDITARNVTHTYSSPGSYTVNLSITNSSGLSFPATITNTTSLLNYISVEGPFPVPEFTGSPRSGNATLTVQFNDTSPSPGITAWNWSFGDSFWFNTTGSAARNATHPYLTEGTYTVNLSVTNSSGTNTTTESGYIVVGPPLPIPAFTGLPTSGNPPLAVQFNDTSPSPGITMWNWSFGDNTPWFNTTDNTARNATHTYSAIGTFTVSLTVTNATGINTTSRAGYISTTQPPPIPSFTGTPTSGTIPLFVQFTDSSTSPSITIWNWSFGDGNWFNTTDATRRDANHTFLFGGSFTVNLTVTNTSGTNTTSQPGYITAFVPPNGVDFTGSPTSGTIPLFVQFTDSSTSPGITVWNWSFGDSNWFNTTDATQRDANHTYTTAGMYTVNLSVTNSSGTNTTSKFGFITATPPPTPVFSSSGGSTGSRGGLIQQVITGPPVTGAPPVSPGPSPKIPAVSPPTNHVITIRIGIIPDGFQALSLPGGEQSFLLNRITAQNAGYVIDVRGNRVTASRSQNVLVIDGQNIQQTSLGLITGSVQDVNFVVQPAPAQVNIGQVAVTAEASLPTIPARADIGVTISDQVTDQTRTAFQQAAVQKDQSITSVGYTATFLKSGIPATAPAVVRMTTPPGWVDQNGGIPAVRVVRIGDDKLTELLATTYAGTDAGGNLIFEAPSPHGLSLFGLVTVKSQSPSAAINGTQATGSARNATGIRLPAFPGGTTGTILIIAFSIFLLALIMVAIRKRGRRYDVLFMK